jgi:hypothetical protein
MKVMLRLTKDSASLYAGVHDVGDAMTFGQACSDAWLKLRQEQLESETSIGALLEHLDDNVLGRLNGARIALEPV